MVKNNFDMIEFEIPDDLKEVTLPAPEELSYWSSRKNRTFYIDYEIEDNYMLMELAKVIIQMNMEEKDVPTNELKPIFLFIHSYGGDLDQCNAFCDILECSRIPIVTVGMGIAMSAGFLIFLSGKRRYAFKHCQFLAHSGSAGFQGTAEQIEEAQKNYKRQIVAMKEHILSHTSIDEKTFNKNKNKDWYITGEDIENYNIAKVITSFEEIQ